MKFSSRTAWVCRISGCALSRSIFARAVWLGPTP
ncbi:Uncharacterised protein [Mycobacteroides abscessus subsp. abscessus]|nr:Uncharacterised protein [Mycobacteroides abscessus subsp. abscessus]